MSKSNKELAVELYCAILQADAIVTSSTKRRPTAEEAVNGVSELLEQLEKLDKQGSSN